MPMKFYNGGLQKVIEWSIFANFLIQNEGQTPLCLAVGFLHLKVSHNLLTFFALSDYLCFILKFS